MSIQEVSNIIDAKDLFFQEGQSGIIDELYEIVHKQETHNPKDLFTIIRRVNEIDVHQLPQGAKCKFQTLCGRVHTLNVNHMVDAIYEEAIALSEGEYASPEELAHRTQTLKEMMAEVWSNHSLSPENSNFLKVASIKLAETTDQTPSSKIDDMVHHYQNNFSEEDEMVVESEVKGAVVTPEWDDVELSIEILQVAQLIYQKHLEGEEKFRELPQEIQQKLGPIKHSPSYIREMVTMGLELVRKDGYSPSDKEIEIMFAEAPPCGA